jgi:type I restriction enzyme S subunit
MSQWQQTTIGELCRTGAGGTPRKGTKEYYDGGSIPWLLSGEVSQRDIHSAKNYITERGLSESSAKVFPKNTVLVAMYGATAGQVGILRFEAATNQAVCGIYPTEELIPEFIYYYLLVKKSDLVAQAVGNAQPNISQIKIKNTDIPLIPLSEQERIVSVLDEAFEAIDTAIANTEKNLSNTEELFQSVLETMLSPQTTISFGSFEEDWDQMKLGDICTLQRGFDLPKRHRVKGSYELVSSSGVIDTHTDFKVTGPGVTTGRSGSIGKVHFIDSNFWPLNTTLYVKDFHGNNPRFVYRLLQNLKLESFAGGTGVPTLNRNLVHPVVTSIPKTYRNQETIAQIIDNAEASINQLVRSFEIKLLCLEELKQSVLEKAFSGELTDSVLEEAGV